MKKNNLIYIALGAIAVFYLLKKAKKTALPGGMNLTSAANQLATEKIKNINFVPDMSTMADEYKMDLKNCK
jgi:hypothetical protein